MNETAVRTAIEARLSAREAAGNELRRRAKGRGPRGWEGEKEGLLGETTAPRVSGDKKGDEGGAGGAGVAAGAAGGAVGGEALEAALAAAMGGAAGAQEEGREEAGGVSLGALLDPAVLVPALRAHADLVSDPALLALLPPDECCPHPRAPARAPTRASACSERVSEARGRESTVG